jgi:hypothetical protein
LEAFFVSTGVVALGEMGDKTQLLAILLAATFRTPLPIIAGIFVATLVNHAAAGAVGGWVAQALGPNVLRCERWGLPWVARNGVACGQPGAFLSASYCRTYQPRPAAVTSRLPSAKAGMHRQITDRRAKSLHRGAAGDLRHPTAAQQEPSSPSSLRAAEALEGEPRKGRSKQPSNTA